MKAGQEINNIDCRTKSKSRTYVKIARKIKTNMRTEQGSI